MLAPQAPLAEVLAGVGANVVAVFPFAIGRAGQFLALLKFGAGSRAARAPRVPA